MKELKRKVNGSLSNGHGKKTKKAMNNDDDDLQATYFESEIAFHSTVTRMKVNALLNEVTLKEKQRNEIDQFIEQISIELKAISQGKVRKLSKLNEWFQKFDIHVPLSFSKVNKKFQFFPPNVIQTIGSYSYDGLIVDSSHNTIIDLLVEMPRGCIHKKDYFNSRYLEKRAIYLCYLAKKLMRVTERHCQFARLNETTLNQTVLLIKPNCSSSFTIRILLAPEQGYMNEKRLGPTSSNLRWKWFADVEQDEPFHPTPNYNASILFDCRLKTNSDYLNNLFKSHIELCNGLKLFKIWLKQRQLSEGLGSFSGAMPAFLFAHLLHTNKLNRQMNSYQVFRIALVSITENDYSASKCSTLSTEMKEKNLSINFDCVLLDQSDLLNVFHMLTRANYTRLKRDAQISLSSFDDPVIDHFQTLFMTSMEHFYSMDAVIKICSLDQNENFQYDNQSILDHLGDKYYLLTKKIIDLLEHGLHERIDLLCPLVSSSFDKTTWSINESIPIRTTIVFGLIFSEQYDLTILKGPESGTKEAQTFRKLWGERCELRRFPDGRILESVIWNVDCAKDKRLVWTDAAQYLLEIHAGISPTHISFSVTDRQASNLLSLPARLLPSYGSGDEQQVFITRELAELSKQLRKLNTELPLKMNSILGVDETFRYTNVFPPLPASFVTDLHKIRSIEHDTYVLIPRSTSRYAPPYTRSVSVLCQLEMNSSNDPGFETLERIQQSKIVYYIQLARLLRKTFNYTCRATRDCCYVERNGYVYRLMIAYHKELYLLENEAGKKNGLERSIKQTNRSRQLRYNTEYLPKINAAIYGVSQQFINYSLVARLFKRWLSSQLLLHHFDPINADLLCCYVFLHSAPFQPPKSMLTGFCRVLRLLRDFDWLNEPLILNFNHELTKDQIFEMQTHFKTDRNILPALCLMPALLHHDNNQPSVPVLKRIIQLATEALVYLEANESEAVKFLFRPSLNSYDVIIMLDPLQCPRAYQATDHVTTEVTYTTRKKSTALDNDQLTAEKQTLLPIVDYDPAQCFVDELRTSYNNRAEFFHDEFGGLIVCVLWKPAKNISNGHGQVDYVQIIEQWRSIGVGIVKEIRTFPERWC